MVNSIVAEYLKANCDKYDLAALKNEMISKGYTVAEVEEAANLLCLNKPVVTEGHVKPLPAPVGVKKTKKHGFNWLAFILVLVAIFIIGVMGMNYAGYDFFGWNMFNLQGGL